MAIVGILDRTKEDTREIFISVSTYRVVSCIPNVCQVKAHYHCNLHPRSASAFMTSSAASLVSFSGE